jgi:hypothetical protein
MNEAWTRRKVAARPYQPKRIRLLLVAESPPAALDPYFYFEEAGPEALFEGVCEVLFETAPSDDRVPFLDELRRRGVFTIELKPHAPRSKEPLARYVPPLLLNIDTLSPEKIILISSEVYAATYAVMNRTGFPVVDVKVPFPAAGHELEFRQKFRQALVRGGLEKLIRPLPPRAARAGA